MLFRALAAVLIGLSALPAMASPPKATAPVDIEVAALDAVKAGSPVRIRLRAVPRVDAPAMRLSWVVPPGVAAQGSMSWTGPARAGEGAELTLTVRLPDLDPETFFAGASIELPGGGRQVKAKALTLPPGVLPKTAPLPPVTKNAAGQPIVEHVVR